MMKDSVKIDLCAVWKHDSFPGFLMGMATELNRDGLVHVPTYQGNFRPLILLPPDQFKQLNSQIEQLRNIEKNKLAQVKKGMKILVESSFPAYVTSCLK